jgi:hypothetical protein
MAWCQNPYCGKRNLSKEDVEFDDDSRMVLCTGCYALRHPGWVPPVPGTIAPQAHAPSLDMRKVEFEAHFTTDRGFTARLGYGEVAVGFCASMEEIKRLFRRPEAAELNG